jgi:hypothetical protein
MRAWSQTAVTCTIACALLAAATHCSNSSTADCGDAAEAGDDGPGYEGAGLVIGVRAEAADCPKIAEIVATPYVVDVGSSARVKAKVTGADAGTSTLQPMLQWSASGGTCADPTAAETTFQCAVPGAIQLTLLVSFVGCRVTASMPIECRTPAP